jgi:hypothetical protein
VYARQPRVLRKQNSVFCVCARREIFYKAALAGPWTLSLDTKVAYFALREEINHSLFTSSVISLMRGR